MSRSHRNVKGWAAWTHHYRRCPPLVAWRAEQQALQHVGRASRAMSRTVGTGSSATIALGFGQDQQQSSTQKRRIWLHLRLGAQLLRESGMQGMTWSQVQRVLLRVSRPRIPSLYRRSLMQALQHVGRASRAMSRTVGTGSSATIALGFGQDQQQSSTQKRRIWLHLRLGAQLLRESGMQGMTWSQVQRVLLRVSRPRIPSLYRRSLMQGRQDILR